MEQTNYDQNPQEEEMEKTEPAQAQTVETPASEAAEEKPAEKQWAPAAEDVEPASVSKVISVINELKDIVDKAPHTFIKAGIIKIDQNELSERLALLAQLMPAAVAEGDRIVRRRDQILAEARGKADELVTGAKQNADAISKQAETSRAAVEHQIVAAKGNLQRIQADGAALRKQ